MTGLEWFRDNVERIENCIEMNGTTQDKVYLVNDKYVVKETSNENELIAQWYEHNNVGPCLVKVDSQFIIYEYLEDEGTVLSGNDIINLIMEYDPEQIGGDISSYYNQLYSKYKVQCSELGIEPALLNKPDRGMLCKLHGDFGLHNAISCSGIKMIDPEPIAGVREHDLIQFYVSDPKIMRLIDVNDISNLFNKYLFAFLYPVLLVDRIVRARHHHSYDLPYYYAQYNKLIKEHKKNLI